MEAGPSRRTSVGSPGRSDDSDSDDGAVEGSTVAAAAAVVAKRKRRERACDHCRSRKAKCDGAEKPDRVCTLCRGQNRPCTYVSKSNKRKNRPRLSAKIEPGLVVPPPARPGSRGSGASPLDADGSNGEGEQASTHSRLTEYLEVRPHSAQTYGAVAEDSPESSVGLDPVVGKPSRVWLGKSSTFASIMNLYGLAEASGFPHRIPEPHEQNRRRPIETFGFQPVYETDDYIDRLELLDFWPADDLALALIGDYFRTANLSFPILREANFLKRFRRRDYQADRGFHKVCLMIFAVAAVHRRDDTRTFAPTFALDSQAPLTHGPSSAGWVYYLQLQRKPRRHTAPPDVSDVQVAVLQSLFLIHSSNPMSVWSAVGEGVMRAYELGAHRGGLGRDAVEDDLFRRGFWSLFIIDIQVSISSGRSPHIAPATYDAALPVQQATANPRDDLASFYETIKVARVMRTAASSLYGLDSAARSRSFVARQMAALTAEIDAIASSLPESLAWAPSQSDQSLAHRSADVHIAIQAALMLINRPALPDCRSPKAALVSALSFDAAVSAAQKAAMIHLDYVKHSGGCPQFWPFFLASSDAATTLGTAIFGWQLAGLVVDEPALLKSLQDCWRGMMAGDEHAAASKPAVGWIWSALDRKRAAPDDPPRPAAPAQTSTASGSAPGPVDQPWPTLGQYGPLETFDYASLLQTNFSLDAFGFGLGFDDSPLVGGPPTPHASHTQPDQTFL